MKNNDPNRPENKHERTLSNESDDSDDGIFEKILYPIDQATSMDKCPICSECKDLQDDSQGSADANTADDEDGNDVIPKVQRGRMKFPYTLDSKASPEGSHLNRHGECHCLHQEPIKDNNYTKASHQDLPDKSKTSNNNSASTVESPSTQKETKCHLS